MLNQFSQKFPHLNYNSLNFIYQDETLLTILYTIL